MVCSLFFFGGGEGVGLFCMGFGLTGRRVE